MERDNNNSTFNALKQYLENPDIDIEFKKQYVKSNEDLFNTEFFDKIPINIFFELTAKEIPIDLYTKKGIEIMKKTLNERRVFVLLKYSLNKNIIYSIVKKENIKKLSVGAILSLFIEFKDKPKDLKKFVKILNQSHWIDLNPTFVKTYPEYKKYFEKNIQEKLIINYREENSSTFNALEQYLTNPDIDVEFKKQYVKSNEDLFNKEFFDKFSSTRLVYDVILEIPLELFTKKALDRLVNNLLPDEVYRLFNRINDEEKKLDILINKYGWNYNGDINFLKASRDSDWIKPEKTDNTQIPDDYLLPGYLLQENKS